MKTIIGSLFVISLMVAPVMADNFGMYDYKVACNDFNTVFTNLFGQYDESSVFAGYDSENGSTVIVTFNSVNGNWSVTKVDKNKSVACMLASGDRGAVQD